MSGHVGDQDEGDPGRKSLFAFLPHRSLVMAVVLMGILAVVIVLQRRAGGLARAFSDGLLGKAPSQGPFDPPPSGAGERSSPAPTRLGPPASQTGPRQ